MATKIGSVDQNGHFRDESGKHWHLTEDHQGAPSYRELDMNEYQGLGVRVDYGDDDGEWLLQVESVTLTN